MTLVINRLLPAGQPGVHVLIVAVGEYPYLDGGSSPEKFLHIPAGQLTSPPVSAGAAVEWLRHDYSPFSGSLATVEVLCSGTQAFTDDNGIALQVERATLPNLRAAVNRWYSRGHVSEENTLVFKFCGHGVSSGTINSLLLEEFGDNPDDPFSTGAVAAEDFMTGMRSCKALKQLYLMDACRYIPVDYMAEFGESKGVALKKAAPHTNLGSSRQVCIWASKLGTNAYGVPNAPTIFTDAWIAAMRGASARPNEDTAEWVIEGSALAEGINVHISRSVGSSKQYATPGAMTEGFSIHVLDGLPVVPVNVVCKPSRQYNAIEIDCNPGGYYASGLTGPWRLELKRGTYNLTAYLSGSKDVLDRQECLATPPSALVMMNVEV